MLLSHIVAAGHAGVIGDQNRLPWHIEGELSRFKTLTLGRVIIMGRKTYQSLPKKLVDRRIIVLSKTLNKLEGVLIARSLEEALNYCKGEPEVFIVGGARVYTDTIDHVDKIYFTAVDSDKSGDAVYPVVKLDNFRCVFKQSKASNYRYEYRTYVRPI